MRKGKRGLDMKRFLRLDAALGSGQSQAAANECFGDSRTVRRQKARLQKSQKARMQKNAKGFG